ncbi:MAG: polyprenyl synthetase family protein, partial [Flavobacteriales bacterium]
AFGDPETFGKQVGGDILADKKTFLWLKAMEKTSGHKKLELDKLIGKSSNEKVAVFRNHFRDVNADKEVLAAMEEHYQKGMSYLQLLPFEEKTKSFFEDFARTLLDRQN